MLCGVSVKTVHNWEAGETLPRKKEIYHILAKEFSVPVNYFQDNRISGMPEYDEIALHAHDMENQILDNIELLFSGGYLSAEERLFFLYRILDMYITTFRNGNPSGNRPAT